MKSSNREKDLGDQIKKDTGSLPLSFIISIRRMIYMKTLLLRNKEELTNRILEEQQKNPTPGDFVELVENDFFKIGKKYDVHLEDFIITTNEKS